MAFSSIYSIIETTPADEVELFLGITPSDFLRYRERFNSSVNAKALVTQGNRKDKKNNKEKNTQMSKLSNSLFDSIKESLRNDKQPGNASFPATFYVHRQGMYM